MGGYQITGFNKETRNLIEQQKIDKNGDGLINDDDCNNELAELLSATGKDFKELWNSDHGASWSLGSFLALSGIGLGSAGYCCKEKIKTMSMFSVRKDALKDYKSAMRTYEYQCAMYNQRPWWRHVCGVPEKPTMKKV